jgi:tRNA dimethylallyltransferase
VRAPVLLLAGPTGVGKSDVALQLAESWSAEIVSADARQVYRGLDVGTAKPTSAQRSTIPHHLIDLLDPDERYSAARFCADARKALREIRSRGRRALVVGGTGLYFKALTEGIFKAPETSPEVREQVDQLLQAGGKAALVDYLSRFDPETLVAIDSANPARLRRAVEFHLLTQESLVAARQEPLEPNADFDFYPVVLVRPRAELYKRIEDRVHAMMAAGFLEEVESLAKRWDFSQPAFDSVGYRELYGVVKQALRLEDAVQETIRRSRQYAKRQTTWFSHQGRWIWMSPENGVTLKITSGLAAFAENKNA